MARTHIQSLALVARWLFLAAVSTLALYACDDGGAAFMPYSATVDPDVQLVDTTQRARATDKAILLLFGANWCEDCRRLYQAMLDESVQPTIDKHFITMHVDIGNWDHNMDFEERWGNPTKGGIPAVVVADAEHEVLYRTAPGELATARHKSLGELRATFEEMARLSRLYR